MTIDQLTLHDQSTVHDQLTLQVQHVIGSHNYIAVCYPYALACHKLGDFSEWRPIFTTRLDYHVDLMAFHSRVPVSGPNSKEEVFSPCDVNFNLL